ncbi:nuclear transport factor 2 family protein [Actinocrispum wychmicini]|uniref:Uncharacterized protein DUF4440 n=1 Tax=Actinocrispum wychmicini TaxID=1213861 RepID=A0A4R2JLR5_9PSEU|nr:nuclear transport factor 2 family protein [Actinocrispum wychmicini]TCO61013.1 uncharacterized protein DUF4440 [Actinocrispum wychmicini]
MTDLLAHDARFFTALTAADTAELETLLHPDFLLVAVGSGAVVTKSELIDAVATGAIRFQAITAFPDEATVRHIGDVGIVVGRTAMELAGPDGTPFTTASRYTHVFAGSRLVSAQGTTIESPEPTHET